MQIKFFILLFTLLLTSCSEKTPTIDGQKNRFVNKFFPAIIDPLYSKGDVTKQKYPIIFLFDGYEGVWDSGQRIERLREMGYHVASIGYFDDAGYSNNLAKVNINDIKKIMDRYKQYSAVDTKAIGVIGRGKGAELALLLASYYPEIKMVVGISAPHVAFQASRATLATESSWVYDGKEVTFVPYPKLSFSAIKSLYRVIVQNDDYRDLHDLAIEDEDSVDKSRIKVENINGDIFLASATKDKMWNSVLMGEEIVKRLKEKRFTHNYKHKSYDSRWFLRGKDREKAWSDIYHFLAESFTSQYSLDKFNIIDRESSEKISFEEYLLYDKKIEDRRLMSKARRTLYQCDKNFNQKIDYFEARIEKLYSPSVVYDIDIELSNYYNNPIVDNSCMIGQSSFKKYDLNSDMSIGLDELYKSRKKLRDASGYATPYNAEQEKKYRDESAKSRIKQCDKNSDNQIDKREGNSSKCQIPESIFELADSNRDSFISSHELVSLPSKYARFRNSFYVLKGIDDSTIYKIFDIETKELLLSAMSECDSNHDFKLDKIEATDKGCGFTAQEFLREDIDRDGFFSEKDMILASKVKSFKKADEDSDGELSFLEWVGVY